MLPPLFLRLIITVKIKSKGSLEVRWLYESCGNHDLFQNSLVSIHVEIESCWHDVWFERQTNCFWVLKMDMLIFGVSALSGGQLVFIRCNFYSALLVGSLENLRYDWLHCRNIDNGCLWRLWRQHL